MCQVLVKFDWTRPSTHLACCELVSDSHDAPPATSASQVKGSCRRLALVLCVGVSFSWLGVALLHIEIPRWQQDTPFQLCTASYVNITSHGAVVAVIGYLLLLRLRPHMHIESRLVCLLLCAELACIALVATAWESWAAAILLVSFLLGVVGSISSVIAVPWATGHDDGTGRAVPALLLGNKLGVLVASL